VTALASHKEESQGGGANLSRHAPQGCPTAARSSTPGGGIVPTVTARSFRRGLTLGLVGGAALTAVRLFQGRRVAPVEQPGRMPTPAPEPPAPPAPWVDPLPDGSCPVSHPVKGKLMSGLFHVPGGFNYPRTKADRCYLDAAAAEADGLRASKR